MNKYTILFEGGIHATTVECTSISKVGTFTVKADGVILSFSYPVINIVSLRGGN